ncbi:hypothetical protein DU60_19555 [Methanosarcina mazei]|uniref:Uncharacterized protein n=1 Tax=Methanosarcina mazei TaxID=2209 RepID=A0A0F8LSG5_METMZ|nr:hypothetical protein DU60_19555 [Methanosarcina mazei]
MGICWRNLLATGTKTVLIKNIVKNNILIPNLFFVVMFLPRTFCSRGRIKQALNIHKANTNSCLRAKWGSNWIWKIE